MSEFSDKLKSAWLSIVALLGVVTTVIGGIDLLRDRGSLVALVLTGLGLIVLVAWLGYVVFARTKLTSGFAPRVWRYRPAQRGMAIVGLSLVVITGAAIAARFVFLHNQPPTHTIILLADFEGPDPLRYRVTETVFSRLQEITEADSTILAQRLGIPISQHEGPARARALGEKHSAAIVIWGFYGVTEQKVPINVNFELLDDPFRNESLYLGWGSSEALGTTSKLPGPADLGTAGNPLRERSELESFALQTDLSETLSATVMFIRGFMHYRGRNWTAAIADFSAAIDLAAGPDHDATRAEILIWRGKAHDLVQHNDEAMADFSRCLEASPGNVRALVNRANVFSKLTKYDEAIRDLDAAIEYEPALWIAYFNRAAVHTLQGKAALAVADLEEALRLHPGDLDALQSLYFARLNLGETELARRALDRALEANPDQWRAHILSAVEFARSGDLDACEASIRRAIALEPESALVRIWAAVVFTDIEGGSNRALTELNEAIALDPTENFARFRRGVLHSRQGEFVAAHADLTRAAEAEDAPAEVFLELGVAAEFLDRPDEAIQAYNRALEIVPRAHGAWLGLAQMDMEAKRWDEAIAKLTTGLEYWPQSAAMLINRIDCQIKTDASEATLEDCDRLLALDPEDPFAAEMKARVLILLDRPAEAEEYYALALEHTSRSGRINYRRAANLAVLKRYDEAEKAFAAAAEDYVDNAVFQVRRAGNLIDMRHSAEAVIHLDTAVALNPTDVATRLDIAYEFARLEALDRAIEIETAVIEEAPDNALAWRRRAMHRWIRDENEAALADARKTAELTPTEADAYQLLGHIAMSAGEFDEARTAYTTVLDLDPAQASILVDRAEAAYKLGDNEAALADLTAAIDTGPPSTDAHMKRAQLFIEQDRLDLALVDIERAVELGANGASVFTYQGGLRMELGHTEKALASFELALAAEPDHLPAIRMRIATFVQLGRLTDAVTALETAIAAHPDSLEFRSQLGRIHTRNGNWKQAAVLLGAIADDLPDEPEILNEAAYALYRSGDSAQGLAFADRAVAAMPERPEFLDTRGHILREVGQHQNALEDFNRVLGGEAVFVESLVGRAKSLLALKRADDARRDLRAAIEKEPGGPFAAEAQALLDAIPE